MAIYFELWNDRTNNLIDEFDTLEQALDEVRWRAAVRPGEEAYALSLLELDTTGAVRAVIAGDDLVRRAGVLIPTGD